LITTETTAQRRFYPLAFYRVAASLIALKRSLAQQNQVAAVDRLISKFWIAPMNDGNGLAPEGTSFPIVCGELCAERDDFALQLSKSVPQRLKPCYRQLIYGTAEAVPFV
jgi:hypothetical protein